MDSHICNITVTQFRSDILCGEGEGGHLLMEWKWGVSQCGRAISKEEGALIWRSEGHPLVALEWCLHVEVEVGCI